MDQGHYFQTACGACRRFGRRWLRCRIRGGAVGTCGFGPRDYIGIQGNIYIYIDMHIYIYVYIYIHIYDYFETYPWVTDGLAASSSAAKGCTSRRERLR